MCSINVSYPLSVNTLATRTHWSTTIPSQKTAVHEGNFLVLFTRQLGGQRVHLVVWSLCVVVLHIHALMWQDLSHTRHMLVVKSVWTCYMANNILVMLAGIQ